MRPNPAVKRNFHLGRFTVCDSQAEVSHPVILSKFEVNLNDFGIYNVDVRFSILTVTSRNHGFFEKQQDS